jgi:hypothetical protein
VLAHERLRAVERAREHVHLVGGADVAQRDRPVALHGGSFARFIGEPVNAALNSGCVMPDNSRAH